MCATKQRLSWLKNAVFNRKVCHFYRYFTHLAQKSTPLSYSNYDTFHTKPAYLSPFPYPFQCKNSLVNNP